MLKVAGGFEQGCDRLKRGPICEGSAKVGGGGRSINKSNQAAVNDNACGRFDTGGDVNPRGVVAAEDGARAYLEGGVGGGIEEVEDKAVPAVWQHRAPQRISQAF